MADDDMLFRVTYLCAWIVVTFVLIVLIVLLSCSTCQNDSTEESPAHLSSTCADEREPRGRVMCAVNDKRTSLFL